MPIPDLTAEGYLPPGIHECTLDEVRDRFGSFSGSDRRCRLFEAFEDYVREVRATGFVQELLIGGSFVTDKRDPGDIDFTAVLRAPHDMSVALRPFD